MGWAWYILDGKVCIVVCGVMVRAHIQVRVRARAWNWVLFLPFFSCFKKWRTPYAMPLVAMRCTCDVMRLSPCTCMVRTSIWKILACIFILVYVYDGIQLPKAIYVPWGKIQAIICAFSVTPKLLFKPVILWFLYCRTFFFFLVRTR